MGQCKNRKCPLHGQVEVPYSGNKTAEVVFLGESPGNEEIRARPPRPFIGDAGKLAKKNARIAALVWESLFIMNSARCQINKKELSGKQITQILSCCRTKVTAALSLLKPKLIIVSGDFALRQIMRRSGITKHRGKFLWSKEFDCWVFPMFHPAYILRNMGLEKLLLRDFKTVATFIENGYAPLEEEEDIVYKEIRSIQTVLDRKLPVSLDTETTGLDWLSPNFVVVSYSIGLSPGRAGNVVLHTECKEGTPGSFSINVDRKNGNGKPVPTTVWVKQAEGFARKMKELGQLVSDPSIKKYLMHQNFDKHAIYSGFVRANLPPPEFSVFTMDVQTGANLIDENIFKLPSLFLLQQTLTDYKTDYDSIFVQKYSKADMLAVPRKELAEYGGGDADITLRVSDSLKATLRKKENRKIARYLIRFTQPTLDTLYEMEKNGAWIDQEMLPKTTKQVYDMMEKARKVAMGVAPKKVITAPLHAKKGLKLTRPDLVRDVLFSKEGFGLAPIKQTKGKDAWSMDKEVRKYLLDRKIPQKARTFIESYDEWQELHTLWSRYLKGFAKHIKSDGRIHSSFSLAIAVTGRISSSNPNMTNNPKRSKSAPLVRQLISAPPDWGLLAADESQCLPADTILWTVYGKRTLVEVMRLRLPVLSVGKNWVPSFQKILNAWGTGAKECVKLTFEDGSTQKCSLKHSFRLWSGEWIEAKDIKEGMQFAHTWITSGAPYPEVGVSRRGHRVDGNPKWRLHRLVAECKEGRSLGPREIAHHEDEDKRNWNYDNIEVKEKRKHASLHACGNKNPNFGKRRGEVKICPECGDEFYRPPSRGYEVTCSKRCSNLHFPRRAGGNHKVVAIEPIGKLDTFQIEVENTHTYVLGNGIVSKNSELRWACHASRDPEMTRIFRNNSLDIHTETGKELAHKDWGRLSDKERAKYRRDAKPINFGLLFGMQTNGFIKYAKLEYGLDLSWDEAVLWITIFFRKYKRLPVYHNEMITFCRKYGYVESPLGRRRRLPEIHSDNKWLRMDAERQAINQPIQEPSSSTVLIAANEIRRKKLLNPEEIFLILFIHDELVYEYKEGCDLIGYAEAIKYEMEHPPLKRDFGFELRVPLVADVMIGRNLAKMKEMKL